MPTLPLIITDVGRQAIVDADNTGTLPITLSEIALGTGTWSPDATATSLSTEIKRLSTVGGLSVAADTLHITITDESTDTYALGEFGLYTDTGVLFAIYSDLAGITDKAADAMLLIAADTVLTTVPAGSVTVGAAEWTNPPATTTQQGVVELATDAEVAAGTDTARAVTPAALNSRVATTTLRGLIELATAAETVTGTDAARAVTPATLSPLITAAALLTKLLAVDGSGSGLDADKVDGYHASSFLQASVYTAADVLAKLLAVDGTGSGLDADKLDGKHASSFVLDTTYTAADVLTKLLAVDGSGSGLDADKLRGLVANIAAAANTIVQRDANGDITTRFMHFEGGDHSITTNDGKGNFNIRIGHQPDETYSDDGIGAIHMEFSHENSVPSLTVHIGEDATGKLAGDPVTFVATFQFKQDGTFVAGGKEVSTTDHTHASASTTVKGLVELATSTETQTGTDTSRAVTPAGLASRVASTSAKGLVELATNSETATGSDSTRAVTPAGLAALLASFLRMDQDNVIALDKLILDSASGTDQFTLEMIGTRGTLTNTIVKLDFLNDGSGTPVSAASLEVDGNGIFKFTGQDVELNGQSVKSSSAARITSTTVQVITGNDSTWHTYSPLSHTVAETGNYLIIVTLPLNSIAGSADGDNTVQSRLRVDATVVDIKAANIIVSTAAGHNQVLTYAGSITAGKVIDVGFKKSATASDNQLQVCGDTDHTTANSSGQKAVMEVIKL